MFRRFSVIHRRLAVAAILTFTSLALTSAATAQSAWWNRAAVFRTKYYSVKTDLPRDEAQEMGRHMDMTFDAYARMFSGLRVRIPAKLNMLLFNTQADYQETLRAVFNDDGTGSWGKCISRGDSITLVGWKGRFSIEQMKPLLQHEGFHQFARHLFPKLPTWANEGIAEIFGRGVAVSGQIALGQVSSTDKRRLVDAIDNGRFKPFAEIFTMEQKEWNEIVRQGTNRGMNYLQAWSIVHFFLYAEDGKYQKQFIQFLVGLNKGLEWKQAFVVAFGNPNFAGVESLWLNHAKALPPMDYKETIRRMEFLAFGLKALRKEGVYPTSVEELSSEMRRIQFKHRSELFGEKKELTSASDQSFQVPYATFNSAKPSFQLVDSRGRAPKPRPAGTKASKSRRAPLPLNITTKNMKPSAFLVRWKRVRGKNEYKPEFVPQYTGKKVRRR